MDEEKRERLEAQGWKVGTVSEFLGMTPEEAALVEIKLALSRSLRERREKQMTQAELAGKIKSSQPRVAKAESGDRSVSIELLMRAMLAAGATPKEIGRIIASVEEWKDHTHQFEHRLQEAACGAVIQIVNVHEARTHFSKLLDRVMNGEEIIIARAGKPVARLVPITEKPAQRVAGSATGKIWIAPDFDSSLLEEEVKDFEA